MNFPIQILLAKIHRDLLRIHESDWLMVWGYHADRRQSHALLSLKNKILSIFIYDYTIAILYISTKTIKYLSDFSIKIA